MCPRRLPEDQWPDHKICTKCGKDLPLDDFPNAARGRYRRFSWCRACVSAAANTDSRRKANRKYMKDFRVKVRRQVLAAYAGGDQPACVCCGETQYEFLALDHTNGGGNAHRRALGIENQLRYYRWIQANNYPPGFQILCHNCNMAKGFYGFCPHEMDRQLGLTNSLDLATRG